MSESWLGVTVSGDEAILVEAKIDGMKTFELQSDSTWQLQKGPRPAAYAIMHKRLTDYVRENKVQLVIFKESALSLAGMKKAHLLAAELRGVLIAAASESSKVEQISKANISKTFGERKVDEYVADKEFWATIPGKKLRVASREAGILLLALQARKFG